MDKRPIGVFDSGLGGLTAVRELRRILPGEDIIYFGDTGRIPYGTRSRETILRYARQDIAFLLSKGVKYLMAACGTVSSTYPAEEAAALPVPYTGVVSAAVEGAVQATRTGKVGVIGTSATIRSGSYVGIKTNGSRITALVELTKLKGVSNSAWSGQGAVTVAGRTYTVPGDVVCYNKTAKTWMDLASAHAYANEADLYVHNGVVRAIEVG